MHESDQSKTSNTVVLADTAACVERHPAPSVSAVKATLHPSVSLRSSRIIQPKQAVLSKVQAALAELKISTHLIMPTRANVERLDALQAALAQVVDLKKAVDRIEQEIRVVRKRKEAITGIATDGTTIKEEDLDAERRAERDASQQRVCASSCSLHALSLTGVTEQEKRISFLNRNEQTRSALIGPRHTCSIGLEVLLLRSTLGCCIQNFLFW